MIARNGSRKRSGSDSQFPGRLHDLMEYVEENRIENVISWVLKGRGFIVNDPDRLVELLPLFFSQTKYRSFRRQLNMWHFERIEKGPSKGAFIHPYFVRGNRELCLSMSRHVSLKPQRGSSIGSNGSNSCSTQSFSRTEIEGENSEPLKSGNPCSSSDTAAALCKQHYQLEPVSSSVMNVSSFLSSSANVTFTSTERNANFDTPDSFTSSNIDLPFIEPNPIRAVVLDSAARKNSTKYLTSLSKVPSYHLLEPTITVANFLKEALCTQPITSAICWDNDFDFLSCSEQDDRVVIDNGCSHEDKRVVPSFIMPQTGPLHHRGATILPPQNSSSLPYRQVSEEAFQCHNNKKEQLWFAPHQALEDGLFCEDVQFLDFDHLARR